MSKIQFPGIIENLVNEANIGQLAQEKQVNLGTCVRLNALSRYVQRFCFSVCDKKSCQFYGLAFILFNWETWNKPIFL